MNHGEQGLGNWLDSIEPAAKDTRFETHVERITAAKLAAEAADDGLTVEVAAARAAGDTWDLVGAGLGVSRAAAYRRFGEEIDGDPTAHLNSRMLLKRPM
jgi:hypothetical protein